MATPSSVACNSSLFAQALNWLVVALMMVDPAAT